MSRINMFKGFPLRSLWFRFPKLTEYPFDKYGSKTPSWQEKIKD